MQPLQMQHMAAGAQAQGTAIVAHRIARRAADLRKGSSGFGHLHAIDHQPRTIPRQQIKRVAAVRGYVDKTIPCRGVACKALRIDMQVQALAGEDRMFAGQSGQLRPFAGINLPGEPRRGGSGKPGRIVPMRHGNHILRGPILVAVLIHGLQQNAEAPRPEGAAIQFRAIRIGKAMPHPAAARFGSIAKKPGKIRARPGLCRQRHLLARPRKRRVHRELRQRPVRRNKRRGSRAATGHQRQIGIARRAALAVLDIVKGHPGHFALQRRIGQWRLVQRPDIVEGKSMQARVLLLQLHQ